MMTSFVSALDKCKTFINSQMHETGQGGKPTVPRPQWPTVTLSRETGSGALDVALKLAEYLEAKSPQKPCPWTVFDKNLAQTVLHDHHLPEHLARYMPEDKSAEINNAVEELLGLHPSAWTLVENTTETILRLANLGRVILIGRAAHVITRQLNHVFHVRLVGSKEKRVQHCVEHYNMSAAEALTFIQKEDRQRKRYLRQYFDKDIEDPLLYHLIINTDLVPAEETIQIIGDAVLRRYSP